MRAQSLRLYRCFVGRMARTEGIGLHMPSYKMVHSKGGACCYLGKDPAISPGSQGHPVRCHPGPTR